VTINNSSEPPTANSHGGCINGDVEHLLADTERVSRSSSTLASTASTVR